MSMIRGLPWVIGAILTCGLVSAQTCDSLTAKVDAAKQKLTRDKNAIRNLGFNTDAAEFDSLATASTEQRNVMAKTAYDNLIGAALDAIGGSARGALEPQVNLPNGYASLNPINVNTFINRLNNPSGPVARLLRQVAATSEKRAKLELLKQLTDAVSEEKNGYDILFGDASTAPRSLEDYLRLTEVLADLGDFKIASKTLQIGTSGANTLVAYANLVHGNLALKQLNKTAVSKAQALATLDSRMRADVQALQMAKVKLESCNIGKPLSADAKEPAKPVGTARNPEFCYAEGRNCRKGCDALDSLDDANVCLEECNIAEDRCLDEPVSQERLDYVVAMKGLKICLKQSQAQKSSCGSNPPFSGPAWEAWRACMNAANAGYDSCTASLPIHH